MKGSSRCDLRFAFTLIELLMVIAIIGILAALLLPTLEQARSRSRQTQCLSQLKQIGAAFHMFAHEHDNLFPWQVSTNLGGALGLREFAGFYQVLSNELATPAIVRCPADRARVEAASFAALYPTNTSYALICHLFTLEHATEALIADRNVQVGPHLELGWGPELHEYKGNLLFVDGHVEKMGKGNLGQRAGGPRIPIVPRYPEGSPLPTVTAPSPGGRSVESGRQASPQSSTGKGASSGNSGFSALQNYFEPPGSKSSSASRSSYSSQPNAPSPPTTLSFEAREVKPITSQASALPNTSSASNHAPAVPVVATSSLPVEDPSAPHVVASANSSPVFSEQVHRSFNWPLLMLLVLVAAGLFGAVLERRRRQRSGGGANKAD